MAGFFSKLNPIPQFPDYPGPYTVGSFEVEISVSSLQTADSQKAPDGSVKTVQYRIFYPAAKSSDVPENDVSENNKRSSAWPGWLGYGYGNGGGEKKIDTSRPVRWLPEPHQREYLSAYARFLGASSGFAEIVSHFTRLLHYISLPAIANAPLQTPPEGTSTFPLMVFSHGLGGTRLAYSYICSSIASHGVVVVAPEHRDGSGPVSFITTPPNHSSTNSASASSSGSDSGRDTEVLGTKPESGEPGIDEASARAGKGIENGTASARSQVDYTAYPHQISDETSNGRNRQLEIRLWELSLIYCSLRKLSLGEIPEDSMVSADPSPYGLGLAGKSLLRMFKGKLDMSPGRVIWAGHSFGSATIIQFVKSIYYTPPPEILKSEEFKPLFIPSPGDPLKFQITPESPMFIMDLWCLPLLGKRTSYLFKYPLPQLAPENNRDGNSARNVLVVMSEEFWKWRENMRGVRRLLCPHPGRKRGGEHLLWFEQWDDDHEALFRNVEKSLNLEHVVISPAPLGAKEDVRLGGQIVPPTPCISPSPRQECEQSEKEPRFYYAEKSAHLSQSDFGVLFPRVIRKAQNPERILKLNVQAAVQWLREAGFERSVREAESGASIWGEGVEGWNRLEVEDRDMTGMKNAADEGTDGTEAL
ncbi:hypothetical protein RUND412_003091 [Rhizina undulata]